MFESVNIRKVANGFVVEVITTEESSEYVFDTLRRTMKFVKDAMEGKMPAAKE
jgi:hypothetical protein